MTAAAPSTESARLQTTDGEIAAVNLESARKRSWSRFLANPLRTGAAEVVLEHEQLTAQFVGELSALDRVESLIAELARVDASSAHTAMIQAQAASMTHRFADARHYLDLAQAEAGGALATDIRHLRLNIDQACGTNLDAVLQARRKLADESHGLPDLVALASLLADMRDFADANRTYRDALRAYHDVSPFPVALLCFHLGLLWGELVPKPDRSRAAEWYRRAIDILPAYTKARIHLAEIYLSQGRLSEAEALLAPAVSSGDPEVQWRLADVKAAQGNAPDGEAHLQAARSQFDFLLEKHLLAFADHGAEFYAGSGNDLRRALDLARVNIANRPTLRAFEQAYAVAVSGGNAVTARELRAEAIKQWSGSIAFRLSPLARRTADKLEGAAA